MLPCSKVSRWREREFVKWLRAQILESGSLGSVNQFDFIYSKLGGFFINFLGFLHCRMRIMTVAPLWVYSESVSHSVVWTLCGPMDPITRLLCPWDSPGKNTGVGSHSLLQGVLSNPGLLHCGQILDHLNHQGSPYIKDKMMQKTLSKVLTRC